MTRRNSAFLIVTAGVVLLGGYFMVMSLTGSNVGTVVNMKSLEGNLSEEKTDTEEYSGAFFSFLYPKNFSFTSQKMDQSDVVLENIVLSDTESSGIKTTLILANRGTTDLMSDPSFQFRLQDKGNYSSKPFNFQGVKGILFEKNSQVYEKTLFFSHTPYIMSISSTSAYKKDGLEEEVYRIISSLHWKD